MFLQKGRAGATLIAAGAAGLCWLLYFATANDPLLGQAPVHPVLEGAGVVAIVLAFVLGGGHLLVALLPGALRASSLQRALVDMALAFVAAYVAFSYYGWDMRGALATSAILSAVIGFSMQPTLGSVVSGVALTVDHQLRIGDGIIHGAEVLQIVSLGWRNVLARKSGGQAIILPNAKLADAEVEFAPAGSPVRSAITLSLPTILPPDRVAALIAPLIGDLAELHPGRPPSVNLLELDAKSASTRYRLDYWVTDYRWLQRAESNIHSRLWYGLQRAGLMTSSQDADRPVEGDPSFTIAQLLSDSCPQLDAEAIKTLIDESNWLLFGSGERIRLPEHLRRRALFLLRGEIVESDLPDPDDAERRLSIHSLDKLSGERYVVAQLACRIGPFARYAVRAAAMHTADLGELCVAVSAEIPDEKARAQFLEEVCPPKAAALGPGTLLSGQQTIEGVVVPMASLRARDEVTLLAIPRRLVHLVAHPRLAVASPKDDVASNVSTPVR